MSFGNTPSSTSIRVPEVPPVGAAVHPEQFAAYPARYGVFAWWPDEAAGWIHPYDRAIAADFIPSDRVWQRFPGTAEYDLFCHGTIKFRAEARMWLNVETENFWIGDWVEVLSQHGLRRPFLAQISEVRWNRLHRHMEYVLKRNGSELRRRFSSDTFRRGRSLTWFQHEDWRAPKLRDATNLRIEPREIDGFPTLAEADP